MEPTLPAPNSPQGTPEVAAQRSPEKPLRLSPEQPVEQDLTPERPAQQEQQPGGQAASGTPPPMPVVPLPSDQPVAQQQDYATNDDSPLVAADEDLIEKEWVDKAKKIITDTKHDPYEQEKAVSRLQAQYLKKRYGKELIMPQGE